MKKIHTMNHRILIFAITILTGILSSLAQEAADTVKVIENATNITIVTQNGKTVLNADYPGDNINKTLHYNYEVEVINDLDTIKSADEFPDNWGMELPFLKDKQPTGNRVRAYFTGARRAYWGWRFNYGGKGHVKNGWEVSIPDFIAVAWKRRGAEFEIGAGFGESRYSSMDGFAYEKVGDRLVLSPVQEGIREKESSLSIASFHVPVLYNQHIGKDFMFSLGAIMNFNTYAKATTKLTTADNQSHTITYKGLQQNLFTVDAYASVDICGIGLFAKWSPMKLFNQKFGPELKGFTVGLQISLMNF